MVRYAILRHEGSAEHKPGVHWDLMLEWSGVLRTWALADEPTPGPAIRAEQLPDHRLVYLDYEGPVSGNRGTVARWDAGKFDVISESPLRLVVFMAGIRLHGTATLQGSSDEGRQWHFDYSPGSP